MSESIAEKSVSLPQVIVTNASNTYRTQDVEDDKQRSLTDEELLAQLGYKQEFKRNFSRLELFGISFSIVGVVQGIA